VINPFEQSFEDFFKRCIVSLLMVGEATLPAIPIENKLLIVIDNEEMMSTAICENRDDGDNEDMNNFDEQDTCPIFFRDADWMFAYITEQPTEPPQNNGKLECGNGMFLKNKNTDNELCKPCKAGKFSPSRTKRNSRCKKCGINKYQKEEGKTTCTWCPLGFNTKDQRGKKQCFDALTGESMKQLGMDPYPNGWKNQN